MNPPANSDDAAPPRTSETESAPAEAQKDSAGEKKLSAEEQMERYEEYLKENDWGHQPC